MRSAGVMLLTVALFVAPPASGSPASRARTQQAYALAYDLQFDRCDAALADAIAMDPSDPAPHRARASVAWLEILFAQGVATFEAFTGEISKDDVVRPAVPAALAARFHRELEAAITLTNVPAATRNQADAAYQSGANAIVSALYSATVQGRTLGAVGDARRAVNAMARARDLAPGQPEPALVLGLSEYTISTMSWPVRTLARLGGLSGNRERGLALMTEAAAPGADTRTDALLLLMIIDNRERRHTDATRRITELKTAHPGNRLLWLNHGATALEAGDPSEADRVLSERLADAGLTATPAVLGETAMWFAHRGTARVRLARFPEAEADLRQALDTMPRDWIRGRAHAQLGTIELSRGNPDQARRDLESALAFAERGGDGVAARAARRQLRALRR